MNGGAIALGHPIGASGAQIVAAFSTSFAAARAATACTLCLGGGGSVAAAFERV